MRGCSRTASRRRAARRGGPLGDDRRPGANRARARHDARRRRAAAADALRRDAFAGARALVCGTGYTGEDGVEVLCDPQDAPALWDALIDAGAVPAGLAARDTLRLEACLHLYGNELSRERRPIEAGLGWCCVESTGFIGADVVARERADGPREKLVAFALEQGGIARQGNPVLGGGVVTSGTMSPSLGLGVGMAYVPAERAAVGEPIEIDVRGKIRPAVIKKKPLYRKAG